VGATTTACALVGETFGATVVVVGASVVVVGAIVVVVGGAVVVVGGAVVVVVRQPYPPSHATPALDDALKRIAPPAVSAATSPPATANLVSRFRDALVVMASPPGSRAFLLVRQ